MIVMVARENGDRCGMCEILDYDDDGVVAQMQESLSQQCILFPFIMVIPPC